MSDSLEPGTGIHRLPRRGTGAPGTPSLLRALNERTLLDILRQHGASSRAQLARDSGLSKPTVSQSLANLEQAGLVRAVGRQELPRGRAAVLYTAEARAAFVMGVDIGREQIRVAVADLEGVLIARREVANRARTAASVVRSVASVADEVLRAAGLTRADVVRTVVGSPGALDPASERLLRAPNPPGWGRRGLVEAFRQALSPDVAIHNDANLAALGERSYGRGSETDTFVYLAVGTGVGMGIIIDGRLYTGAHGLAGEVGLVPVSEDAATVANGAAPARGSFEDTVSGDALIGIAQDLGMRQQLTVKQLFAAARDGDRRALDAIAGEGRRLAGLIASIAAILDPGLVVLGGDVGGNLDLLRVPLEQALEQLTPMRTPVVASRLGEDVVLLGAIATALDTALDIVFEQRTGAASPRGRVPA